MFAYCQNNPIVYSDQYGHFPVLAVVVIGVSTVVGGVLGGLSEKKLGPENDNEPARSSNDNSNRSVPRNYLLNVGTFSDADDNSLTTADRIKNIFIGAACGLAVGGAIVATGGAAGSVIVGSATTVIPVLGGTGAQTFAIGALAYNAVAMLIAPIFGVEMEPIEIEP